ncbi:tyrosine--tRNA ligase 2, cytoplasmic-like [Panicum virgatum]|uniref:tyrosine--tRNA ligase n=1 Tax=Panicum virgatum TaxID=38727 RepID=A0A8T0PQC3_PANVG|nr:tyrosine--tRNA ligase 2, cytoplasmic-like [Panicum virgatum]KAG2563890.1 hypothetical protein PVAP13_8KG371802 [Panicum virgatum]
MTPRERLDALRGATGECDCVGGEDELLLRLLRRGQPRPVCLDGFEPSAAMDIARGVGTAVRARAMARAGCRVKIVVADWFALLGGRMGGDWGRIRDAGSRNVQVWEAALRALGVGAGEVEFLWSSDEVLRRAAEYWQPLVMDIAEKHSVERIVRCCKAVFGRDKEQLTAGQFMYPIMQCADVFFYQADICHMAMDQREVNLLARDYCKASGRDNKPTIMSYHMLPGLKNGQKISDKDPSSAIFMGDSESEVNKKINKAFCPPGIVEANPCLEYIKQIILPWSRKFVVLRTEDNGGNKTYNGIEELFEDFRSGALHPADVKSNLKKAINEILQCVRDNLIHFESNSDADVLLNNSVKRTASTADNLPSRMPVMTSDMRFKILHSIAEKDECTTENELKQLLQEKPTPICYDGFEPSGRMHIAQGVGKAISIDKMLEAGCKVKIWIADWFAMLNNKMGGNLKQIRTVGLYMIEIWKALGMNLKGVEFLWASEEIDNRGNEYWPLVIDIAHKTSFKRIIRCCQIMGRSEKDALTAAQIMYPLMQCADIFFLKVDICQMGLDQRKVNMLARDYCEASKRNNRPIILSHHMLPGIKEGQQKMSKSDPSSAIFMEDNESQVNEKIGQAFCPHKVTEGNPCLEYIEYIVLPKSGRFAVLCKETDGSNRTYSKIEELREDYRSGTLHPDDVKLALAKALNDILQPVRDHFEKHPDAQALLDTVKAYRRTGGSQMQSGGDHTIKEPERSSA